jgi:hypothetical protein
MSREEKRQLLEKLGVYADALSRHAILTAASAAGDHIYDTAGEKYQEAKADLYGFIEEIGTIRHCSRKDMSNG